MKFDRETLIVFLIAGAIVLGWTTLYPRWTASRQEKANLEQKARQTAEAESLSVSSQAMKPVTAPAASRVAAAGKTPALEKLPSVPVARKYTLQNKAVRYFFNSDGVIQEIELSGIYRTNASAKDKTRTSILIQEPAGFEPFSVVIPPDAGNFRMTGIKGTNPTSSDLELTKYFVDSATGAAITVVQKFRIGKDNTLQCTMALSANRDLHLSRLIVWGGALDPLKQLSNDDLRDIHQLEYCLSGSKKAVVIDASADMKKFMDGKTTEPIEWVAASNKYFLSLFYSHPPFSGGCELINFDQKDSQGNSFRRPGIAGVYGNLFLKQNVPSVFQYTFYAGPKDMAQMRSLPESAFYAIHLAYWSWLEPLCRPMLWLLNKLNEFTKDYGLSIILLTVLVKLVLWPLIHKGNKSMRKLQRVQPMVKDLKEKYKDQPQEFQRRMMELYAKEKVSPFGGCFPMILQIPIFIALYSTLDSAVELRHASFLWATDLSRPDLVGPTIYGIGLHPFILLSTGLMVLQQKLSPPIGDPTQRKVMMFMPVMMLVFFYSFPSGLALYWTVNNVLSILQMLYSQYAAKKEEELLNKNTDGKKTA